MLRESRGRNSIKKDFLKSFRLAGLFLRCPTLLSNAQSGLKFEFLFDSETSGASQTCDFNLKILLNAFLVKGFYFLLIKNFERCRSNSLQDFPRPGSLICKLNAVQRTAQTSDLTPTCRALFGVSAFYLKQKQTNRNQILIFGRRNC